MSELSRAELRTLCSYLALPGMMHTSEILEETRAHIANTPLYDGKLEIIVASSRIDLITQLEEHHGASAFASLDISNAAATGHVAQARIPSYLRRRIYRAALQDRLARDLHTPVPQMMAACDCHDLHRVLIEECPPSPHDVGQMLLDPRITESQAWRKFPEPFAAMVETTTFKGPLDRQVSMDAVSRRQIRALAILCKIGAAQPVPSMIVQSSGCATIAGLCHELASNHRRVEMIRRLPSVSDLLMASGKQVERMIDRALLPEDWPADRSRHLVESPDVS